MDLITRERDRLLSRTARLYGLVFAGLSLLTAALPGSVDTFALLVSLPLYVVLVVAFARIGSSRSIGWVVLALLAGVATVIVLGLLGTGPSDEAGWAAIVAMGAGALPALALVLTATRPRVVLLVIAFVVTVAAVLFAELLPPAAQTGGAILRLAASLVLGWLLATGIAIWISVDVPQVAKRIASIGRAHRAERQASELEAQRRQSARLLHDTVLATLTLLAHSGVGVTADALRQQAADDARLLRQLRLGNNPVITNTPFLPGAEKAAVTPVSETTLGTTLESVKQRFGRMGLQVAWHGTGQVLLPAAVLDAFLMALAECLENVRRHSGVTEAHVTITEDDTTVRALVTDQGVGFDIANVDDAKLGFNESVVGRLRDVGGSARLFSAPGAGTTVVLEVPR